MRLVFAVILALSSLVAGCGTGTHALDPRWRPLELVVERPPLLLREGATTTLGSRVYVADLDAWLERHPDGSVEQEALLLHEREHAVRQLDLGLGPWLRRYLNDRRFMWAEEQRGHFLELRHLQRAGRPVVAAQVALRLSRYRNLQGRMVSFAEALAWVQAVLAGRWTPDAARG